ncbi:MAG: disulfide bond formation protein B [Burkholderiales bacterium]|nr:disulfide bond formation protein B [Burkholderiales bacterium]
MRIVIRLPQVLVAVGLVSLGAVGLAAIAQYVFDMQPCPWCVLQRLIYIVVGVLALVAAALPGLGRRLFIALALLGAFSGLAAALWQQLHAVNEASCAMTLADRIMTGLQLDSLLPQLFTAYASCADAAVSVLGIPFAVWSCLLYVLLAWLLVWSLRVSLKSR